MDLRNRWSYIEHVAEERLRNNKTANHVSRYGPEIEILGAAGELAARVFFHLPEELHTHFDGGTDIRWRGYKIDVKATHWTNKVSHRYLQWPEWKPIGCDIILMTAVDLTEKRATILGYATSTEVADAPINQERFTPCHEIPISELRSPYEIFTLPQAKTYRKSRDARMGLAA